MEDLISIIIPIYKVEKYLKKCIDSIINQTYQNLEIILVEDGSPDNCGKICDEYAKIDERITVIHKENGGQAEARNYGIEIAKGKYITFVDSDDYITEDYVQYMYDIMKESNSDISICAVQIVNFDDEKYNNLKQTELKVFNKLEALENMLYSEGIEVAVYAKLYPKEYFKDIRFTVGEKYEDIGIIYKLLEKAEKIAFGNQKCYFYFTRQGSTSKSGFNQNEIDYIKNVNQMLEYLHENYPNIEKSILRYRLYSNFRILRILLFSENKNEKIQQKSIKYIKENYNKVLKDKRAPKRDKLAVLTFLCGIPIFKLTWFLYSKMTGRIL